jgi:hypothetical protein
MQRPPPGPLPSPSPGHSLPFTRPLPSLHQATPLPSPGHSLPFPRPLSSLPHATPQATPFLTGLSSGRWELEQKLLGHWILFALGGLCLSFFK